MGNCSSEELSLSELELYTPQLSQYKLLYVIGKGGFGRVWKVKCQKRFFALKEMIKSKIIEKQSIQSVMNERILLQKLNHPFLVNMRGAFQTLTHLYIVLDYMEGGDLRYHLCKQGKFSEEQTKFFVICILMALQYLHKNLVLHRDIKPENLVFDDEGYLHITDMGIARIWKPNNKNETSGTPGYMAPEVMMKSDHGVACDYFALGCLVYECLTGKRPYQGKNRRQIRELIMSKQVKLNRQGLSKEVTDFVNRLLERKANQRLGNEGPDEVMSHPWLKNVDWGRHYDKLIEAPYKIIGKDNFDTKFVNQVLTISEYKDEKDHNNLFQGFTYIENNDEQQVTDIDTNKQKLLLSTKYY
ncbi:unnamed protein product (macronuclear) [Paramecium tetraurelia]|uniref:Protein kinase domain-containing protein n=1 Tax=Paramecium tetraurelia TaxID=5888 RepID=A0BCA7_PARTE|nr:uncharacterized protein GSPATT00004268001 [Paramecium tetraurelia]CAK56174.1 unnamed protein product [Paramecium tetraurelia]|eukprot:XP_001423572.1 hypothetical protein (macronuclear) [Paramecium tetraurelia strain d4-2]